MKNVEVSAKIPDKMAKAIIAATLEMPSLKKDAENKYGGYVYVGIDEYLAAVPRVAAKHGLFWITRELNCEVIGEKGNHLAYTFALDLGFEDGTWLPEYSRITVVHPLQGAQTAGSALAYGEKMLTRFVFKVVTGEQDADATDNSQRESISRPETPRRPAKPVETPKPAEVAEPSTQLDAPVGAPAPVVGGIAEGGIKVTENERGIPLIAAPKEPDSWKHVAAVFVTFAPQCGGEDELKDFWNSNIEVLDKLKVGDEALYKKVQNLFKEQKKKYATAAKGK